MINPFLLLLVDDIIVIIIVGLFFFFFPFFMAGENEKIRKKKDNTEREKAQGRGRLHKVKMNDRTRHTQNDDAKQKNSLHPPPLGETVVFYPGPKVLALLCRTMNRWMMQPSDKRLAVAVSIYLL